MQKEVLTFEDLKEGMAVTGKIKNVVDFGAFVDLGIKESALVHISELSDNYVKNPMDLIKVGDVLEFRIIGLDRERRRISLSRKSGNPAAATAGRPPAQAAAGNKAPTPTPAKKPFPQKARKDDDGSMYSPFAEAFKKIREK
jgi:uncharacterized protein